jgi:RNA-directed DNA polymerase
MKRVGYIYDKICDIENIKTAIMRSSLGKRNKPFVKLILNNIDDCANKIQVMLINKSYVPSPYTIKVIQDASSNKERTIYKPRYYPDQIIHWALMLQVYEIFLHGMYEYTCGSVPGRGTSFGQKILRKWLDTDYKGTKYCLKMDITKFYPSIDRNILKIMLRKHIKDSDCLWLLNVIIDSNLQGLPIGNYTSQWLSNFFLQELDHFIKDKLGVKYYIRYVDDLVILGSNKRRLHRVKKLINEYLDDINLKIKPDWQVFLITTRAIDFLGLRFFRDKTILRKRNALRIKRRMTRIGRKKVMTKQDACAVVSYWGWIKRSDSYRFYNKYIKPISSIGFAKRRVSYYAKLCNNS